VGHDDRYTARKRITGIRRNCGVRSAGVRLPISQRPVKALVAAGVRVWEFAGANP